MTLAKQQFPDTHHDVSSNTIFGFWLYLMTDCVMFATFFAAYAVLHNSTNGGPTASELLSIPNALLESLILLTSSFACGMGLVNTPHQGKNRVLFWFAIAFVLAVVFMGLGFIEFQRLIEGGNTWQKNAFLSAYFTLISVHGLHIAVGLIFMVVFAIQLLQRGFTTVVLRRLASLKMYWHFLYFIWIFTFAIVYLIGAK